jgi:hypothetical protein
VKILLDGKSSGAEALLVFLPLRGAEAPLFHGAFYNHFMAIIRSACLRLSQPYFLGDS